MLRAISPKIGNFARAIKSSRDHVCASADAIASDRSRKTKGPEPGSHGEKLGLSEKNLVYLIVVILGCHSRDVYGTPFAQK